MNMPRFILGSLSVIAFFGFAPTDNLCAAADDASDAVKRDAIVVRALERMEDYDYADDEAVMAAVRRHIERQQGTPEYLSLLKRFQPGGAEDKLMSMVLAENSDSDSVEALGLLLSTDSGVKKTNQLLRSDRDADARRALFVLGLLGSQRTISMMSKIAGNAESDYGLRAEAVRGLSGSNLGAETLLGMVETQKLPADTRLLAGGLLARSTDANIRAKAAKWLPRPAQADQQPLPPLDQLAQMSGNLVNGKILFRGVATCSNCHVVADFGKPVGPDLSEIGSKLSREAMFTSILDPSAGISHNYENHVVLLDTGQVIAGVMVSETDDEVTLRTAEAIDRTIKKDSIEEMTRSSKSIMPENLHHTTDQQGLIDVVEYLMSLKKKTS